MDERRAINFPLEKIVSQLVDLEKNEDKGKIFRDRTRKDISQQ